jgi:rod shape-determining protein MreD
MGAVLGQHALVYALACFIALKTYRRVMVFNAKEQAFYALLLLLLLHGIMLMIRITAGNLYPGGWIYFLSSFTTAAFWPAVPAIMQFLRRPTLSSPIP